MGEHSTGGEDGIDAVRALLRHHDGIDPLLVAVDGCRGAGKSTFAAALAARLEGSVVCLDDFYRPMDPDRRRGLDAQTGFELYFDWQRLIADVLDPLVLGEVAVYRRYDRDSDAVGEDVAIIEPHGVIVFEGIFSHRPQLRGYWDISVWVDAAAAVRARRIAERGDDAGLVERWAAAEEWYATNLDPRSQADVVVAGS